MSNWAPSPRVKEMKFNSKYEAAFFVKVDRFFALLDDAGQGVIEKEAVKEKLTLCFQELFYGRKDKLVISQMVRKQMNWLFKARGGNSDRRQFGMPSVADPHSGRITKNDFRACYEELLERKIELALLTMDVDVGIRALAQHKTPALFKTANRLFDLMLKPHAKAVDRKYNADSIAACFSGVVAAIAAASDAEAANGPGLIAIVGSLGVSEDASDWLTHAQWVDALIGIVDLESECAPVSALQQQLTVVLEGLEAKNA